MAYFRKPKAPTHSAYTAYQSKPLRLITTAYQTAGITPPDFGDDRAKQLHQELTVEAAAEHYAQALYDGDKPKALEQAIKAISRATAADYLKEHTPRLLSRVQQDHEHQAQATAIEAVTPRFQQVVEQLRTNAQQLPAKDPLDKQAAFNNDLNTQWRTTTAALQQLGSFAVVGAKELYENNAALGDLLPIAHIPDTTPERGYLGERGAFTPLPDQAGSTDRDAIRALANDALTSRDQAIINIARGKYGEHIYLALADTTELARRVTAAQTAQAQQHTAAPITPDGRLATSGSPVAVVSPTETRWMNP